MLRDFLTAFHTSDFAVRFYVADYNADGVVTWTNSLGNVHTEMPTDRTLRFDPRLRDIEGKAAVAVIVGTTAATFRMYSTTKDGVRMGCIRLKRAALMS